MKASIHDISSIDIPYLEVESSTCRLHKIEEDDRSAIRIDFVILLLMIFGKEDVVGQVQISLEVLFGGA